MKPLIFFLLRQSHKCDKLKWRFKRMEFKGIVEIENLSDFIESAKDVIKKAEELEVAVRRLNKMELELKTKTTNK
nr:MAG TPA: hypothetical protein [Caudoviricetes sp.]